MDQLNYFIIKMMHCYFSHKLPKILVGVNCK